MHCSTILDSRFLTAFVRRAIDSETVAKEYKSNLSVINKKIASSAFEETLIVYEAEQMFQHYSYIMT